MSTRQFLNRTIRHVDVTGAGAAYCARCAHLVEEARVAHEQLAETIHVAKGTLRVSCTPDAATQYLALRIGQLLAGGASA